MRDGRRWMTDGPSEDPGDRSLTLSGYPGSRPPSSSPYSGREGGRGVPRDVSSVGVR